MYYGPAEVRTARQARAQREALDRFVERLRARSEETDLLVELETARDEAARTERTLTIEVEDEH